MAHLAILGTRGIPARYGGFESFAERLATELVARGHRVTVFCQGDPKTAPRRHGDVELRTIRTPNGPLGQVLFDLLSLVQASRGYDVVYMLGYIAGPFCVMPRLFGRTVWLNPDGLEWAREKWARFGGVGRFMFRAAEKLAVATSDLVVADSRRIAEYHEQTKIWRTPVCFVPYGAEVVEDPEPTGALERFGLEHHKYYIVVCRVVEENHVLEIVQGFDRAGSAHPLVVVGDTHGPGRYRDQVRTAAGANVRLVGTIFDREVLSELRHSAIAYVHGHSVGGTNPSLLEALGAGNPVIAHDNRFNREVAADAALYFDGPDGVVEAVAAFESEAGLRRRLAARARERAATDYAWDDVIDRYDEMLARAIDSRSEPLVDAAP